MLPIPGMLTMMLGEAAGAGIIMGGAWGCWLREGRSSRSATRFLMRRSSCGGRGQRDIGGVSEIWWAAGIK